MGEVKWREIGIMIPNTKWVPTADLEQTGLIVQHGLHFGYGMSLCDIAMMLPSHDPDVRQSSFRSRSSGRSI